MTDQISIKGLNKATVLAALYNASSPQRMGFMAYDPAPMEVEEAQDILSGQTYFDYLKGRVMKIDLSGDDLSPWDYDRDNGAGTAARVIDALRQGEPEDGVTVSGIHSAGKTKAISVAREGLNVGTSVANENGIRSVTLGLADVAEVLGPKIDEAEG